MLVFCNNRYIFSHSNLKPCFIHVVYIPILNALLNHNTLIFPNPALQNFRIVSKFSANIEHFLLFDVILRMLFQKLLSPLMSDCW